MMIHHTSFMTIMFFIIFFFFFLGGPAMAVVIENPLVELSTKDDLARLAGYGEERLSMVVVGGTLLCDACLDRHPVPGASVAVSCHTSRKMNSKSNWVRGTTDEYGDFLIDLPSRLHAIPNMENRCLVRLVELPNTSPCSHRGALKGKRIHGIKLSSSEDGIRTYTTQEIHLKHKHYSQACIRGKKTTLHML